jgi:hypothetical protein
MPNKKNVADDPHEDKVLEKRVDAMMDPKQPDKAIQPQFDESTAGKLPPIDIFKDLPGKAGAGEMKTAPDVPTKLLKPLQTGVITQPVTSKIAKPLRTVPAAVDKPSSTAESANEASPELPAATTGDNNTAATKLDDTKTDEAIDDIVAHESDQVLAAEDAVTASAGAATGKKGANKSRIRRFFTSKWTWLGLAIIIIALFALPVTRYKILGLVIKKTVTATIVDSKTGTPVSSVVVTLDGKTAKTNANGKVSLHVPVGKATLKVSEQYYKPYSRAVFVGLKSSPSLQLSLVATGRQVPVKVVNSITGKPIAGAVIAVLKTSAKTNAQGEATIVLPTTASSDKAAISLAGYNGLSSTVQVTDSVVAANTFKLTPTGKIYFLSNASGTIDVVKTNLDGSDRQTVLAGTGQEDPNNTTLLTSPDWQYLVLQSQRSGSQPALYLINTSTDKSTEFDSTDAAFDLVGWVGDDFVYDITKNAVPISTTGHEVLKSYNATTAQLNQLDQDQAIGSGTDYAYQTFSNITVTNDVLVYVTQWYTAGSPDMSGQSDTIRTTQPNGQGKKDLLSLNPANVSYIQASVYQPGTMYYAVYDDTNTAAYYTYQAGSVTANKSLTQAAFNQAYPHYYLSPDGSQTFWSQVRDGQNTLFTGDSSGQSQKQLTSSGTYLAWGWFGDNYLLVTDKDNSQLYIMPLGGSKTPLKVADYYSSARSSDDVYGSFGN